MTLLEPGDEAFPVDRYGADPPSPARTSQRLEGYNKDVTRRAARRAAQHQEER